MTRRAPANFPQFGEEYDGKKLRQFAESVEYLFNQQTRAKKKISAATTAIYDCLPDDDIVLVDRTSTGTCNVKLPLAELFQGVDLIVMDRGANAAVNNITITAQTGDTINGAATYVMNVNRRSVILYSDGSNWFISAIF